MLARYVDAAPAALGNAADIRRRYHILAAQRHARVLGVFVRLNQRDGKPGYLKWMPRVARQLCTALDAAQLTDIAALMDANLPHWQTSAATITPSSKN
jgi:aminoglycoside/choline kinase family phosphotransferase